MTAGDAALELTIGPCGAEEFLNRHWEREPLVVSRDDPHRFDDLLAVTDVERLLSTTAIRAPAFRLVKDGSQIPLADYTEDISWRPGSFSRTADVGRVTAEFERGATAVLQALQLHWHPTAVYCRSLEQRLSCPVQANAYYTPASAQGFAVHHDTHDVFVLQCAGRKRWRVYEPVRELPLKGQRWRPDSDQVGEPTADFVLEAGDTLYLPRGWPHEAEASDLSSLHLTVGLHPYTRLDAMRAALESCAEEVDFRRALGADGALPAPVIERFIASLEPDQVAGRMRRRFISTRRPLLEGQFAELRALEGLDLDQKLERRSTVVAELELNEDGAALAFDGRELIFPPQAKSAVEAIFRGEGAFTVRQLPGPLDEEGRLVLVRRLVREGFLRLTTR